MDVINTYVEFRLSNFTIYAKMIMGKYFDQNIFNLYLDRYKMVRYYNQEITRKSTLEATLNASLEEIYLKNNSDVSKFIFELFKMFYYLDGVKKFRGNKNLKSFVLELDVIRREKLGFIDDEFVSSFMRVVLDNEKRSSRYFNRFSSNDFSLQCKKIRGEDIYLVNLLNNIEIPSLYSKYAIDKVLNESRVSVDILFVLYYLISICFLKDIVKGNFKKKYLLDFSVKIFSSLEKRQKFLKIFDDDITKENFIFKIDPIAFLSYEEEICSLIHEGYSFGLIINSDDQYNMIKNKNLDYFSYLFLDKKLEGLISDSDLYILI